MKWSVGHAYLIDEDTPDQMCPSSIWWTEPGDEFEAFRNVTDTLHLPLSMGLPGRVAASGKPVWISNVMEDPEFIRAQISPEIGVKAALAFPITIGDSVWGVLEFFSRTAQQPDPELLEVMGHIGVQLGHVVERKRAERALHRSEARYRKLTSTATDAIITITSTGRVTDWNAGAERLFGYRSGEMLDRDISQIMPTRYRMAHEQGIRRVNETGEARVLGRTVTLEGLDANGREFPIELSLSQFITDEATYYTAIIRDISDQKKINDELRQSKKQLQGLARRLQAAREEERKKLAQDVHDILGQALTGINLDINVLEKSLSGDLAREHLEKIRHNIKETIDIVRRIATNLRPGVLDHLGLVAALEWQATEFGARAEIVCRFKTQVDDAALDPERSLAIFRVFQELLTNVARHAQAAEVEVCLIEDADDLLLVVQDNGCGIEDVEAVSKKSLGILGIRERLSPWDGTLELTSVPGEGTRATVRIPFSHSMGPES